MKNKKNPPTPRFRHNIKKIKAIKHIPQDIVQEILLRLPVKSLSRFKCVSKPWCSLISSKGFIKAHLERSRKSPSIEHHWIITEYHRRLQNQCPLPSFLQNPLTKSVRNPPYCSGDAVRLVGSCNGLVCLLTNFAEFILWNPTTGNCKKLDPIFDGTRRMYECVVAAYGFGFDESNDEYKVFGVLSYRGEQYQRKIYSSKTSSWRKIDDDGDAARPNMMICGLCKLVSGKLHWAPFKTPSVSSDIVTFDLAKEAFGTVEWPSCDKYEHDGGCSFVSVQVIDERLSCLVSYASRSRVDVWILNKYSVRDSWRLLATRVFDPFGNGWTLAPARRPNILESIFAGTEYEGEEEVADIYSCLYVYDGGDARFSKPCLINVDEFLELIITIYVESLVMI